MQIVQTAHQAPFNWFTKWPSDITRTILILHETTLLTLLLIQLVKCGWNHRLMHCDGVCQVNVHIDCCRWKLPWPTFCCHIVEVYDITSRKFRKSTMGAWLAYLCGVNTLQFSYLASNKKKTWKNLKQIISLERSLLTRPDDPTCEWAHICCLHKC